MGKQNEGAKSKGDCSRDNYMTWSDESTKYMLQWYIDAQRDKPLTFKWKAQHHLQCANALNDKFGIAATAKQVDRHFRSFKEKWKWIRQAMGRSGFGFDAATHKFNIDKPEKSPSKLGMVKFNYLTHSIKFFPLLEELFGGSAHADGSLAIDVNAASDNDESEGGNDVENYTSTTDQGLSDSDTIAQPSTTEHTSSSVKRKHVKSPAKKASRRHGRASQIVPECRRMRWQQAL